MSPNNPPGFSIFNPIPVQESMMSNADVRKRREAQDRALSPEEREQRRAAKIAEAKARRAERERIREEKRLARLARVTDSASTGRMAALRDAKLGYVKSATGQLRASDEIAIAFDAVPAARVISIAQRLLALDANPYAHLNLGQQSMNLRNRLRGAVRRGTLTMQDVLVAINTKE